MDLTSTSSRRFIEGPLSKWTNVVNGWQYRWFVLDQSAGLLSYYTSKDKMKRGSRRGCLRLRRAIVGIDDEDDSTFTIRVDSRIYHFQAHDREERQKWVQELEACIKKLHQSVHVPTAKKLDLAHPEVNVRPTFSLRQRIAESEGYYQLLQEQVQTISQALNSSEEAFHIKNTSKLMLEALKQCIELLQKSSVSDSEDPLSGSSSSVPVAQCAAAEEGWDRVRPKREFEGEEEEEEEEEEDSISEASSDEFFDADTELEYPMSPTVVTSPSLSVPVPEGDPPDVEEEQDLVEEDDTSGGVAANKSVIMHMLSQVRLGMDLTKIVLPTFILEKRSLLQMYAEFFSHPDLFASIGDNQNPKERMIAIVRYFLSAFHASRKGTIAKKPYNPILGETFSCYWDLPNGKRNPPDDETKELLESGPVPLASYDSIAFTAEQVSHHPPVSGFYAECLSKRMFVNASFWTKSRFLGLSLAVNFIGKVSLTLMDYGEEYTVNLPNAYARSILTVPWMEMGGKCVISCAQTGYSANVDFHSKPFYGGKKHRVTADIFDGSDKKPFMKIEGEWNGTMYVKHSNGDQELFFDTLTTPTIRKKTLKVSVQEPTESTRLWQDVTRALLKKDVESATAAKHKLEQKQREDAKERLEKGMEWKQKLFHAEGNDWIYNLPLSKRLAKLKEKEKDSTE